MTDFDQMLKSYRRKPLATMQSPGVRCGYTRDEIQRIIPHRAPFLFLDHITAINLENATIMGETTLPTDDPVFAGHFPGNPIYPAVLQLEMVGQLGLCLHYFLNNSTTAIPAVPKFVNVRVTRILGAHFLEPVGPGQSLTLISRRLEADDFFETYIGQIMVGNKVCSVSVGEICLG
jgi:3-hydroxyacyl-[acyl-carrier-protein] dehydratase